ncbi:M4 family metallopeptidase [Dyadobacter sp. NIV53]|uniref:M4 family metallopeptidase n=1 Tax=Dyadobacter sp. NIV53 TaxID=2861765 RepID=UPI001C88BFD0|nr:M4 family metallopeptidase [Dyadobacter sp. NIV53]
MKNILPILSLIVCAGLCLAQNASLKEINDFAAKTGAIPTIDKATNSLSFLRFPSGKALKITGATTGEKALAFLKQNSGLFDIQADKDSYQVKENKKDNYGLEHVVLQQYYEGIPVYDGILKFHFDKNAGLSSLNGNFIPVRKLDTKATVTEQEAAREGLKRVTSQKLGNYKVPLKVIRTTLYVFQKGLARGFQGTRHLVYEVEVRNDTDVREFIFIDAHTKATVEQFTGIHNIVHRVLYEESTDTKKWEEGDAFPGSLSKWQQSEVVTSGQIYNFMKSAFHYASYDNKDAAMVTINNNPDVACPNATWNGVSANFCDGTASDDVIAHEWAHAYTEYTSELIYAWQPGAMNEAYSDIWGETVDLLNGYMDNGESNVKRTDCGSSDRWQLGEQATAFDGSIRDLWDPTCKGNPGKVTGEEYHCDAWDVGGVHTNSGVLNHAYALLVDGGTYNGQMIRGLGLTKAAHIFWRAQANYMTRTTDFAAQADILEAALSDLTGINLTKLSTADTLHLASGKIITPADAAELAKVIAAVELRAENNCNFQPILKPVAEICNGGQPDQALFYEDFEDGLNGWTVSNTAGSADWIPRNWVLDATPPDGRGGKVVYAIDPAIGNCTTSSQHGVISLTSPVITIPAGASGPFNLAFDQYIATEPDFDGGNISYRLNDGDWALVPAYAFTSNSYNTALSAFGGSPLRGQPAFSGVDEGSIAGSWGQSRIDLSKLRLVPGQSIQFRWDFGTDGCYGLDGWYIDDVRVYSCALPSVQFVSRFSVVSEAEGNLTGSSPNECLNYVDKIVTVKINKAPSAPVNITLNLAGTAKMGPTADYTISPSTFVLQAGKLFQDVIIRIYNDAYLEQKETIKLTYSLSTTGDAFRAAGNQEHRMTIEDDDIIQGPADSTIVLLSENFNDALLPPGWEIVGGDNYPYSWTVMSESYQLDKNQTPFLMASSNDAGNTYLDVSVETAPFNTFGFSDINISFVEYFGVHEGGFNEQGILDVWDGSAWHTINVQNEATGNVGAWNGPAPKNISIPAQYANAAMKLRFRYIGRDEYWWAIDDIKVTGHTLAHISNTVSSAPDEKYLGPNGTVYFHDPETGNLMLKIKNLSNHDYGCTSVAIDRVGIDETDWVGPYHITSKTFVVNPTHNNPNGRYEITLYYRPSELPNFDGIVSMGKSEGSIATGNLENSSFELVRKEIVLHYDLAYTAIFNSGFSGFGLSDASPITVINAQLPVKTARLNGSYSTEGNLLNWTTTSNTGRQYFAVERSSNGRDFVEAGRIEDNANSAIENTYKFTDSNHPKGISYYRIKQIDKNGKFAYSRIISIEALNVTELKFFPNPVQSTLTVELPDPDLRSVDVKIINNAGQEIFNKEKVKSRNGSLSLEFGQIPSGTYQVILTAPEQSERHRLAQKKSYHLSVLKL